MLTAMRAFTASTGVQEQGCGALRNLARDDDSKVTVAALGGVEVVLAGMRAHVGAAGVQEAGCGALYNIFCDAGNVQRVKALGAGGVRDVVGEARAAHPSNSYVQSMVKHVLDMLAR